MPKRKSAKTKVLSGHTQVGKKFYPPAARLGWTEVHYIERILPEIAWLGYFIERFGTERGLEFVETFLRICFSISSSGSKFFFCSAFHSLTADDWTSIRKACKAKGMFLEVLDALTPYVRCYPSNNSLQNFFEEKIDVKKPSVSDVERARAVVNQLFDRRSQTASIVQSIIPKIEIEIGRFHVPQDYPFVDFDSIITAFNSEHTDSLCSHVRMHVNSSFMMCEGQIGASWARGFLESRKRPCALPRG
jgi:hypothetical protein